MQIYNYKLKKVLCPTVHGQTLFFFERSCIAKLLVAFPIPTPAFISLLYPKKMQVLISTLSFSERGCEQHGLLYWPSGGIPYPSFRVLRFSVPVYSEMVQFLEWACFLFQSRCGLPAGHVLDCSLHLLVHRTPKKSAMGGDI